MDGCILNGRIDMYGKDMFDKESETLAVYRHRGMGLLMTEFERSVLEDMILQAGEWSYTEWLDRDTRIETYKNYWNERLG